MSLRAGDLNRRITIQMRRPGRNELGEELVSWVDLAADVPAGLLVLSGKEYAVSSGEISRAQVSMRVRWRTDVTAKMRVLYAGGIYNIEAVLPDLAGREYVDLACSIGASHG